MTDDDTLRDDLRAVLDAPLTIHGVSTDAVLDLILPIVERAREPVAHGHNRGLRFITDESGVR